MEDFCINIDDGSEYLSSVAVDENIKRLMLYDWQYRAINYFFKHKKALYEVATGSGKSRLAVELIKQLLEKDSKIKILIVVPKNIILEDTWLRELYNGGFTIRDIGVFYGLTKEYGKNVTLTNMQSINKIAINIFDCIILDECHNYSTKRLLKILSKEFKYMVGLSATIERRDKGHYKLLEMFNYNMFTYSPHDALRDGVLNPFNFVNIGVELDDESMEEYLLITQSLNAIMKAGGGYTHLMKTGGAAKFRMLQLISQRNMLVNNYKRKFDIVKLICEKHKEDKMIIFNQFNKQTSASYWYLLDIGVRACVMHSGIPQHKREQDIKDFRNGKYNVMLASKVLDEGWNLPSVDTAIIAAGDSTAKQSIQRMGRVLRRKHKHSNLYQIYCLNTIEEQHSAERCKLFKELCSKYNEYIFGQKDKIINW
jgi:RNA polymerase primary sigma factor